MPQCPFVKKGYVVDPDDYQIYHNYSCTKPEGHSGNHSFYKNPSKFYKAYRSAQENQQKMIQKMEVTVREARTKIG